MGKSGKFLIIEPYKEDLFSVECGVVDAKNMKTCFLILQSYVIVENIEKTVLNEKIKHIKNNIRSYIRDMNDIHFQKESIVIMNVRMESRDKFIENLTMFFEVDITFFYKNPPTNFKSDDNKELMHRIFQNIVEIIIKDEEIKFNRNEKRGSN